MDLQKILIELDDSSFTNRLCQIRNGPADQERQSLIDEIVVCIVDEVSIKGKPIDETPTQLSVIFTELGSKVSDNLSILASSVLRCSESLNLNTRLYILAVYFQVASRVAMNSFYPESNQLMFPVKTSVFQQSLRHMRCKTLKSLADGSVIEFVKESLNCEESFCQLAHDQKLVIVNVVRLSVSAAFSIGFEMNKELAAAESKINMNLGLASPTLRLIVSAFIGRLFEAAFHQREIYMNKFIRLRRIRLGLPSNDEEDVDDSLEPPAAGSTTTSSE